MPDYLLDANFFIQAHRVYYPMDVVPGFWNKLIELAAGGRIGSIDKVRAELFTNEDDLTEWCRNNLPESFFDDSASSIPAYRVIIQWSIDKQQFTQPALDHFASSDVADAWLVSYALEKGIVLITHEVSSPDSRKNIKLPDVCIAHGVRYLNTVDMFRELGEQF